jgi:hypothetical protein
MKTPSMTMPAI